ncbi:MAG: hypothetical protein WBW53_00300 [Terriglobales bacterium]
MINPAVQPKPDKPKRSSWWWPGVVATSLAGAAVVAFRGCWHRRTGWPVSVQGYSYRVCLDCGAMRLFDEKTFSAYGAPSAMASTTSSPGRSPRKRNPTVQGRYSAPDN